VRQNCNRMPKIRRIVALTSLVLTVAGTAGIEHVVTAEDVLRVKRVEDIALSPDGSRVLFVVRDPGTGPFSSTSAAPKIWIESTDGAPSPHPVEAITFARSISPAWAPDGRSFAFLSRGNASDGDVQLYVLHDNDARPQQLTNVAGGIERFAWSPAGDAIAYTSHASTQTVLSVISLKDGVASRVSAQPAGVQNLAWSPDARQLALIVSSPNVNDYGAARLLILDRKGNLLRTLTNNVGESGILAWSPNGRWIAFIECVPKNVTAWWLSVVPAGGGRPRAVLKNDRLSVIAVAWSRDSSHLLAQIIEGTRNALVSIDVPANTFRLLSSILSSQGDFSFSSNGSEIAYVAQTVSSPNDVWLFSNAASHRLTALNPQTASWALGSVREVSWKNRNDGLRLEGILVLPPGFRSGNRYPTIVECHLGDEPWWYGWDSDFWDWAQLLASNGYVVFQPNTRGVSGQGWKLHETLNDWGGAAYRDLLDGVDSIVKDGIADPKRLGIAGWSNGGFMTAYATTHTARFKAAVIEDGHIDFFSLFGTGTWQSLILQLHSNPYIDRRPYDRASPITTVRRDRTPTLLLWGEDDPYVPVSQGYELKTALDTFHVENEMVVYPKEGHEIDQPVHQLDMQRRVLEWFRTHL
jgi:dipeptidyl aminopeptidase/acylaminoacyl peptidase